MNRTLAARCRAFSLVEILLVVVILGILAAIAVPKLAGASQVARENALKDDLRLLRTQLGVYKSQHAVFPGFPGGDPDQTPTFELARDQLLKFSDVSGNTADAHSDVFKWGPYLTALPVNPMNGNKDVRILGASDAFVADGATGWLYQPATGIIKANVMGLDSSGKPIIDY